MSQWVGSMAFLSMSLFEYLRQLCQLLSCLRTATSLRHQRHPQTLCSASLIRPGSQKLCRLMGAGSHPSATRWGGLPRPVTVGARRPSSALCLQPSPSPNSAPSVPSPSSFWAGQAVQVPCVLWSPRPSSGLSVADPDVTAQLQPSCCQALTEQHLHQARARSRHSLLRLPTSWNSVPYIKFQI